jgi:hypothetical protein
VRSVPPCAKRADYSARAGFAKHAKLANTATNAKLVFGHRISTSPKAGDIPVVDADGKLPASLGAIGPQGPKGDTGAQGAVGLANVEIVTAQSVNDNLGGEKTAAATCPSGKKAIGGGGQWISSLIPPSAWPVGDTAWRASGYASPGAYYSVKAYVVCATVAS